MQVVILAGGLGTRMRALAPAIPKCLIEVAGRPFADLQLGWLSSEGATDVLFSIGYLGDESAQFCRGRIRLESRGALRGRRVPTPGDCWSIAIGSGPRSARGPRNSTVLYGDSYLTVSLDQVAMAHHRGGLPALMTVFRNEGRWEESNTAFDAAFIHH